MNSAVRAAGNWMFRDRATGRIVIAQRPNVPFVVWLGCEAANRVVRSSGGRSAALPAAGRVALAIWAVDEIVRGVNPWRRLLGAGVIGAVGTVQARGVNRDHLARQRPGDKLSPVYVYAVDGMSEAWTAEVRTACQRVFTAAEAGFASVPVESAEALLWEADPVEFAARYPDSGVVESYGDSWPPPCIDYWLHVDASEGRARLAIEGWNTADAQIALTGEPRRDASAIAQGFAQVLRIAMPR